jgi:hypothetical protein
MSKGPEKMVQTSNTDLSPETPLQELAGDLKGRHEIPTEFDECLPGSYLLALERFSRSRNLL